MDNISPRPKSQKEISNSLVTPYSKEYGNPNDYPDSLNNKSNQISFKGDNTKPFSIGLKDIDESIFYYFNEVIKPQVLQNGIMIPIPIIYGSPERWVSTQKQGYLKDKLGKIMAPLIMFKRDSIEKNRTIGNKLDANQPHNYVNVGKKYTSKNSYDNFAVLNNRIPEETVYVTTVPDYITITYSCLIYTYYVDQMNKVVEAINYASDSYWGDPERFKFQAKIDSFNNIVEMSTDAERTVKSTFNIKLNGYILPEVMNKDISSFHKSSTKTQVIFSVESTSNNL